MCEIIHHKKFYWMMKEQFIAHCQTDHGKKDLTHYGAFIISIRLTRGKHARISARDWGDVPNPREGHQGGGQ